VTVTAAGQLAAPLTIAPFTVRGVRSALLTTPQAGNLLTFSATPLGKIRTDSFTIRNRNAVDMFTQTSGPLTISVVNTTDFQVSGCAVASLQTNGIAATEECVITVTYQPKSVAASITGSVQVSSPLGGSVTISLAASSTPSVTISPTTATIATNGTQAFTVTLDDASAMQLETGALAVGLGGTNAASFELTANTCTGKSLKPGDATCSVTVKYVGTGAATATLSVSGSVAGNVATATLTGQ
jgi:hypothetical protein